mgnify:FL=1
MTPQELKNSILQLAIQGKLVEQRPEEGTAEELFVRIQEEKQRLIKEKKIRKAKPLPEIDEDEKAFDLPVSWKWCRLGDILYKLTDGTHSTPRYVMHGVPFLSVKDMSSGKLDFSRCKYISEQEHQELYSRCNPELGDLLVTKVGTTGIPVIVDTDLPFSLFVSVALLKFNQHLIYNKFLQILINAPLVQKQVAENTRGVGNKNWVMRDIANTIIVLPPLAEQKRIVDKIEELLPYFDRYEQTWSKLEKFNGRFPEDMKKSLLQYAIQGKLVEQRPEEGTAEELFEQIQEEKHRLIKEKKIKKEKPLPEITDDEKPFDIPESWKWVRVGEIFAHNTGKAMNSSAKKVNKAGAKRKFITTSNLYWNSFDFSSVKEMFFSDDELERCTVRKGDLLMCEGGAYYGRTAIWNYDYDICFQNHIHRLRSYKPVELLFFYHLFYFYKSMNMMKAKGTAMPGLSSQTLHQMVLPLPPLSEQKRIVEKLERLLPLCEQLK